MTNANNVTLLKVEPANILEHALKKPCPFCGATDLSENLWSLNGGEVDAIECNGCQAGAPAHSWLRRK